MEVGRRDPRVSPCAPGIWRCAFVPETLPGWMARLQLFEFEDQEWCPGVLRRALTGYLRLAVLLTGQARPVIPALADLLRSTGETSILDLCSGSGGLWARTRGGRGGPGATTH